MNSSVRVTIPDEVKSANFIDKLRLKFIYPDSDVFELVFRNVEVLHISQGIDEKITIREASVSFFGQTFIVDRRPGKSNVVLTHDGDEYNESPINLSNLLVVGVKITWNGNTYSEKKSILADRL